MESEREFHARLFKPKPVRLAALGDADLGPPAAAPAPADLAETEDVQFTPAIQGLARSLDHNPVKIYRWVSSVGWVAVFLATQHSPAFVGLTMEPSTQPTGLHKSVKATTESKMTLE
jgi:hypothetical protein